MKNILFVLLLITFAYASEPMASLEQKVESGCASCHLVSNLSPERVATMKAPPMWGVMKKVKAAYPEREKAEEFMVEYMQNPSEDKMLFRKQTIARFGGIMPSQKSLFTEEELREISNYLFERY
ncbi:cytochrome c [Sulfurimonas sp. HSL-1656]|uniref:cytochrome c n=1 Tax=Thiomicrolovo subterrani TaxID=3131934 RepID=UPI0031F79B2C